MRVLFERSHVRNAIRVQIIYFPAHLVLTRKSWSWSKATTEIHTDTTPLPHTHKHTHTPSVAVLRPPVQTCAGLRVRAADCFRSAAQTAHVLVSLRMHSTGSSPALSWQDFRLLLLCLEQHKSNILKISNKISYSFQLYSLIGVKPISLLLVLFAVQTCNIFRLLVKIFSESSPPYKHDINSSECNLVKFCIAISRFCTILEEMGTHHAFDNGLLIKDNQSLPQVFTDTKICPCYCQIPKEAKFVLHLFSCSQFLPLSLLPQTCVFSTLCHCGILNYCIQFCCAGNNFSIGR